MRLRITAALVALLACASTARAQDEAASPKGHFYAVALAATTLAYRPPGGSFLGPQKDVSPQLGAGYFVTDTLALELDVGPTLVEGEYAAFAIVPALIWAFHPNIYGAGRFVVPVDPELNLVLLPGIGATYAFANGLAPFLEVNLASAVGRGDPDFGVALALGLTYLF